MWTFWTCPTNWRKYKLLKHRIQWVHPFVQNVYCKEIYLPKSVWSSTQMINESQKCLTQEEVTLFELGYPVNWLEAILSQYCSSANQSELTDQEYRTEDERMTIEQWLLNRVEALVVVNTSLQRESRTTAILSVKAYYKAWYVTFLSSAVLTSPSFKLHSPQTLLQWARLSKTVSNIPSHAWTVII